MIPLLRLCLKAKKTGRFNIVCTCSVTDTSIPEEELIKFRSVFVNPENTSIPEEFQVTVVPDPYTAAPRYAIDGKIRKYMSLMRGSYYIFDTSHPSMQW